MNVELLLLRMNGLLVVSPSCFHSLSSTFHLISRYRVFFFFLSLGIPAVNFVVKLVDCGEGVAM